MSKPEPSEALTLQRATERALVAALDAGAIGFMEVGVAASLAAPLRRGGDLTVDQARQAWRLLNRNAAGLARAGIDLPQVTAAATAPRAPTRTMVQERPSARPALAIRRDGRIGVENHPYALRLALKTDAMARWDTVDPKYGTIRYSTMSGKPQWSTPATPAHAGALLALLAPHDPALSPRVEELAREYVEQAERRAVLTPGTPVPTFDTTPYLLSRGSLWEHQFRAVEFAATTSASLLAIPMGGGKSAAAITVANRVGAQRVVIVGPNKVRPVWPSEVDLWSRPRWHIVDGTRPSKIRGGRPQSLTVAGRLEQAEHCLFDCDCDAAVHAVVLNYESLATDPFAYRSAKRPGWVPPTMLDLIVYDEAHRLGSPTGITSKTAAHWVSFFRKRVGLTGTPMPQHPWDIFGLYRALDPGIFGELWTPFKAKYVEEKERKDNGRLFPVGIRREARAEFVAKVHSIMYRPTIDLQLPGTVHRVRAVALEPRAMALHDQLNDEMVATLDLSTLTEIRHESDEAEPTLSPLNKLSRVTRMRQLTGGTVYDDGEDVETASGKTKRVRNAYRVSTAKAEALADVLEEVGCVKNAATPEPVIVYCAFRDDLDVVAEVAAKAGLRFGEISGRRNTGLDSRAKLAADVDVCAVQISSGGTGIDLTRSAIGVWYSPEYSAGNFDQALKRQDRPGQTRKVRFIYLVAVGTVDEDVYRALAQRKSVTNTILAARGVDLAKWGLDPRDVADASLSMVDVQALLAERDGPGEGRVGGVTLPIDDYATDVYADEERRPPQRPADMDKMRRMGLEGFFS